MKVLVRLIAATVVALSLVSSGATPGVSSGLASDNVQYVSTVPFDAGTAWGARLVGDHLYVSSYRHFTIYDVSDPLDPQLMSTTPTPTLLNGEDVDTNGKILLLTMSAPGTNALLVYDVEDKSMPKLIATLEGAGDHTMTCLMSCRWAYGSTGTVVDLRKPASPKIAGSWRDEFGLRFVHDVTEVAPSRVLVASRYMLYLDARKDPTNPKVLATGYTDENLAAPTQAKHAGSTRWPRSATDDFVLFAGESPAHMQCNDGAATLSTWDATKWRRTESFKKLDDFRVSNGGYADGSPPAGALGCTPLWFDDHPKFRNGGLIASAWAEHGTRILSVDRRGQIREEGWFMPFGGEAAAAYWITNDIVYSIDLVRGIDILRITN